MRLLPFPGLLLATAFVVDRLLPSIPGGHLPLQAWAEDQYPEEMLLRR